MSIANNATTKYLFKVAFPLMLGIFSSNAMMFIDRAMVAQYSLEQMNAVFAAGIVIAVIQLGLVSMSAISEVICGKEFGAQNLSKVPNAAWQMIFFACLCSVILIPLALWGGEYLIQEIYHESGLFYFKSVTLFIFFPVVYGAIVGFFVGINRTKIIAVTMLIGNITNVILDYLLIFGAGPIPAMGADGAAIATVIAMILQTILIFVYFISKKYNDLYNTRNAYFDYDIFIRCFKVGLPSALTMIIEISAWATLLRIVTASNYLAVTPLNINNSVLWVLMFSTEGIRKAVIGIASNMIGSKHLSSLPLLLKNAIILHLIFVVIMTIPTIFASDMILGLFLTTPEDYELYYASAKAALFWCLVYYLMDGVVWIIMGILTAYEDTKFIMYSNAIMIWSCCIFPAWLYAQYYQLGSLTACKMAVFYITVYMFVMVKRVSKIMG